MTRIAFIGLGNMGGPMAANLVRAGHTVTGFDLSPASLEAGRADGLAIANSAREAVAGAEVVVTMLPAGQHVRTVYGESVIGRVPAGIHHSTRWLASPSWTKKSRRRRTASRCPGTR